MSNKSEEKSPSLISGKSLLVVNTGGIKKSFILKRLKQLGIHIIAIHKEKNWAEKYVDERIITDTSHHEESLDVVGKYIIDK